jgi:hypothetical protein
MYFKLNYITLNTIYITTRSSCDVCTEQANIILSVRKSRRNRSTTTQTRKLTQYVVTSGTFSRDSYTSAMQSLNPWSDTHTMHRVDKRAPNQCARALSCSGWLFTFQAVSARGTYLFITSPGWYMLPNSWKLLPTHSLYSNICMIHFNIISSSMPSYLMWFQVLWLKLGYRDFQQT